MTNFKKGALAALLIAATAMTGCSESKSPHSFFILIDKSPSAATANNKAMAEAAGKQIEALARTELQRGSTVHGYDFGDRTSANLVEKFSINVNSHNRPSNAAAQLGQIISKGPESTDRVQSSTSLVATLELLRPKCGNGNVIYALTDALETEDLQSGATFKLTPPKDKYLVRCRVVIVALGMNAPNRPQLSNAAIAEVRKAWREYLLAAGVRDSDIELISHL